VLVELLTGINLPEVIQNDIPSCDCCNLKYLPLHFFKGMTLCAAWCSGLLPYL
jgi:hypothetical protein